MGLKQSKLRSLAEFFLHIEGDGRKLIFHNHDFTDSCANELIHLVKTVIPPRKYYDDPYGYSHYHAGIISHSEKSYYIEATVWDEDFDQYVFVLSAYAIPEPLIKQLVNGLSS